MTGDELGKKIQAYIHEKQKQTLAVLEIEGRKSVNINFEEGGRPAKWKPSKKLKSNPGAKTLIDKGNLRSFSSNIDYTNSRVILGLNPLARVYGRIQNEGGSIKHAGRVRKDGTRGNPYEVIIPQRRFFIIPESDFPRIVNSVRKLYQ